MKHMNLIYATASLAVAQEGFADGWKDFFSIKLDSTDASHVSQCIDAMEESAKNIKELRHFSDRSPANVVRFLFKDDHPSNNLVADMRTEAKHVGQFNEVFKTVVEQLENLKSYGTSQKLKDAFRPVRERAMSRLGEVRMLNNFYAGFHEKGVSDAHATENVDRKLNPKYRFDQNDSLIGNAISAAVHVGNVQNSNKLMQDVNDRMDFSVKEFKAATMDMVKEAKITLDLIERFLVLAKKHKSHDSEVVRFMLRYCHSLGCMLSYVHHAYTPFFRYMN